MERYCAWHPWLFHWILIINLFRLNAFDLSDTISKMLKSCEALMHLRHLLRRTFRTHLLSYITYYYPVFISQKYFNQCPNHFFTSFPFYKIIVFAANSSPAKIPFPTAIAISFAIIPIINVSFLISIFRLLLLLLLPLLCLSLLLLLL